MWRISAISEDWVDKGCHIHIGQVQLAVRPDTNNKVIFRRVFTSTSESDFDLASRIASNLLADAEFRHKLREALRRAMAHMLGITGYKRDKARGRSGEFKFLILALDRLETS
jgi:hypothetical protein